MSDSVTPLTEACQAFLSFTISQSLLKLMSIELMIPSKHLILCQSLLFLTSVFPGIRVFSNESAPHIRWPKYWSFSFNISLSNEYSGLISFKTDWFDTLAVQRTLKSFLHHHSLKASILWCSAFSTVQLSHLYMTALQVSFNFMASVTILSDFWAQEKKNYHCFHFFPSMCHEVMGLDTMILVFFLCWVSSQLFHCPLSPTSRGSLVFTSCHLEWYHLHIWGCDISPDNLDSSPAFLCRDVLCI